MSVTLEAAGSAILPAPARTEADSEQIAVRDGLAVYRSDQGEPILLMPYPHGYTIKPTAAGPLAIC